MLVISRKIDQEVKLTTKDGTVITLKVLKVAGSQVRIGIEADKDIHISRG